MDSSKAPLKESVPIHVPGGDSTEKFKSNKDLIQWLQKDIKSEGKYQTRNGLIVLVSSLIGLLTAHLLKDNSFWVVEMLISQEGALVFLGFFIVVMYLNIYDDELRKRKRNFLHYLHQSTKDDQISELVDKRINEDEVHNLLKEILSKRLNEEVSYPEIPKP